MESNPGHLIYWIFTTAGLLFSRLVHLNGNLRASCMAYHLSCGFVP